ncbi:MAG: hypothetical protein COW85_11880, partial [Ignavibacteria bacterium CG22_combo_CG10-13_8_21_14_all_37_15]
MKLKQLTFLFVFVLLTASGLLQAGVQSTATVTGTDKGVNVTLPAHGGVFSGTFKATINGNPTSLYCIDINHNLAYNENYQDVEATDYTLAYILNNYYPFKNGYAGELSVEREASAVQLALWHLSDGLDINSVTSYGGNNVSDIKTRALAIVADANLNAHSFNLNTFVINIPAQSFAIGSPVTFTVKAF